MILLHYVSKFPVDNRADICVIGVFLLELNETEAA